MCARESEDMRVTCAVRGVIRAGTQRRWGFSWGVDGKYKYKEWLCPALHSTSGHGGVDRPRHKDLGVMWNRNQGEMSRVTRACVLSGVSWQSGGRETKVLLWEFERGASACPLQLRDLDVGKEKAAQVAFQRISRKDGPSCRQIPHPRAQDLQASLGLDLGSHRPLAGCPWVVFSLHCHSRRPCQKFRP